MAAVCSGIFAVIKVFRFAGTSRTFLQPVVKYGNFFATLGALNQLLWHAVTEEKVRIDKWLWAARFYKTRSMAAKAVSGGHVHVNGDRVKSARGVGVGDALRIVRDETEFVVIVRALSDRRGPAPIARTLYEETEASIAARQKQGEDRRLMRLAGDMPPPKRPGKRDRRLIRNFTRKSDTE